MRRSSETTWGTIVARAERGDVDALEVALRRLDALGEAARRRLLTAALTAAEAHRDYTLLVAVLRQADGSLRSDALAVTLGIASETNPLFEEVTAALRDEERALLVGALLEASRLDPDPERRLLRLERLTRALERERRDRFWPEARALAERGGDDAQLTLLGFARHLSERLLPRTLATLRRSVRKVRDPFKRAAAFLALGELAPLDREAVADARSAARRIPDPALRAQVETRLEAFPRDG